MDPVPTSECGKTYRKLKNKMAMITGKDSGIGRAVAYDFAKEGACVVIVYYDEERDAKGAMVALTRSLSLSLAEKGIRVNGVAPGPIWTPLIPASYSSKEVATFGKKTAHVPMDRAGQPCEVSPCYVFLASDDSAYMTGQALHPNGGTMVGS